MPNEGKQERLPIVAICYDFDKTLSPDDMQAQGFIQSVGYDVAEFWKETGELARENNMDSNLSYMYKMVQEAEGNLDFSHAALEEYGSKVKLFDGVDGWFERLRQYGLEHGVKASSFYFDENGMVKWPAQVVNYTNKTQYLFRISKGVLDINDPAVNDYFAPEDIRIPFKNMVYIGDSDTDVPCMKLVNANGGYSIGVYNPVTGDKNKVYKMIHDKRIGYYAAADYTDGSDMDKLLKSVIDVVAAQDKLDRLHAEDVKQALVNM